MTAARWEDFFDDDYVAIWAGYVGPDQTERDQVAYRRRDLRRPLPETGFDAALNVFTSIGYDGDEDDLAVFRALRAAVRPGGLIFEVP
jgi:hypothetical protein